MEGEVDAGVGEALGVVHAGEGHGVPGDGDVDVIEAAGADHKALGGAAFLGRAAVVADAALDALFLQPVLHRGGGEHGAGAEQVVAAAVAGGVRCARGAFGNGILRQAGERVVLGDEGEHGLAAAVGGYEGGGNTGDTGLDGEAGAAKFVLQQRGALRFLVADFGEFPDLAREGAQADGVGVDARGNLRVQDRDQEQEQPAHTSIRPRRDI